MMTANLSSRRPVAHPAPRLPDDPCGLHKSAAVCTSSPLGSTRALACLVGRPARRSASLGVCHGSVHSTNDFLLSVPHWWPSAKTLDFLRDFEIFDFPF